MEALPMAGGAISAYGQIQQGKSTSDSLKAQANNLDQQAAEAEQKGAFDAMRQQLVSGAKIGESVAAYGAAGVTSQSGSVLDVVQASHQNAELDRLNILHGADIRAINYQNQASMDRFGAESAIKGSYWSALGSLTGGAISAGANSIHASPKPSGGEVDAGVMDSGGGGGHRRRCADRHRLQQLRHRLARCRLHRHDDRRQRLSAHRHGP